MDKNMQGKIVKGISGFYYVHVAGSGIYECKAKGIFRNQKIKPLVGDNVTIAVLDESRCLEISRFFRRKCPDPSGGCQHRSGACDFCGGKAKAEF